MTAPVKDRTRRFAAGKYRTGKRWRQLFEAAKPGQFSKKSTELFRKLKETAVC
jgi:hypothetical protein